MLLHSPCITHTASKNSRPPGVRCQIHGGTKGLSIACADTQSQAVLTAVQYRESPSSRARTSYPHAHSVMMSSDVSTNRAATSNGTDCDPVGELLLFARSPIFL